MKLSHITLFLFLAMLVVVLSASPVSAQGESQAVSPTTEIGSLVWTFINSPVGLSILGFLFMTLLGWIRTKPKWKLYLDKYRPVLLQAVRMAEKAIPDGTPEAGLKRLDTACQYVLKLNSHLEESSLAEALTAVHSEVAGGLKTGD